MSSLDEETKGSDSNNNLIGSGTKKREKTGDFYKDHYLDLEDIPEGEERSKSFKVFIALYRVHP